MPEREKKPPGGWRQVTQGAGLARLTIIMCCVALHAMDVFVIATILPSVVEDIQGVAYYAWPAALYVVTSIMGAASGGTAVATLGLRRALVLAVSIYLLGAIVCATAPHMLLFLMGRTVQGLGAGLLVSLAYSMIRQLFDEDLRPRVFAFMSIIWGAAALAGPLVAGIFAQMGYWRGVYWLSVPVFLALVILARRILPTDDGSAEEAKLPWRRLLLLGGAVLCVIIGGRTAVSAIRLALIASALIGITGMLWLDHRAESRLLPSRPTSFRAPVGTGYWIFFLFFLSNTPLSVFLPLLAQKLHAVPPSLAGYVAAAMSLGWSTAAFATAGASQQMQRVLIITGPLCILLGIFVQGLFILQGPLILLVAFVFLTGLGIGQCHAHISNHVMSHARPGEESVTAGAIPTLQTLGIAFGAAAAGILSSVAGLSEGFSIETLSSLADWIYGFALFPATICLIVSLRFVWLIRKGPTTS
ncbi:MAG: MFS transporter [Alphaproteobacteria bacterium]